MATTIEATMERRADERTSLRMAFPWILVALLALSACESPIGPHADQETWVFEMTHVYLEEEGGERDVLPVLTEWDQNTPDGAERHESSLDRVVLTLHPDGTGLRETRQRWRVGGGEWEVFESVQELYWGEWRFHQFQLRLAGEVFTLITRPQVTAQVRDRGNRLVTESHLASSPRLEHWVRVE
jgi:hypothetical protein